MQPPDLETLVHLALTALPPPQAPRTLLPRVMAGIHRPRPAWHQRAWWTWPVVFQFASLAVLVVVVWASTLALPAMNEGTRILTTRTGAGWGLFSVCGAGLGTLVDAASVLQRVSAPAMGYVVSLTLAMCAAFAVCSAAIARVVLGGSSQS